VRATIGVIIPTGCSSDAYLFMELVNAPKMIGCVGLPAVGQEAVDLH
jgi:hypothetical protein